MKDERFKKAIEDIRKISMSSADKQAVLKRILSAQTASTAHPKSDPVKSPWTVYSFSTWIQKHRWVSAIAAVVIVLLAGNTAVMASYDSLPGDALYPIKVKIVEPVRIALASTPVAKAEIQAELVQERLQEAETLVARGTLTDTQENEIRQRVEEQTTKLALDVAEINKTSPEKAQDIDTTIEASFNTHERVLVAIATNRGQLSENKNRSVSVKDQYSLKRDGKREVASADQKTEQKTKQKEEVVVAVRAVREQPVAVPAAGVSVQMTSSVMVAPSSPEAATTAMPVTIAIPATTVQVDAPAPVALKSRVIPADPAYQKKKARVQSLIKKVSAEIASTTSSATTSLIQQTITEEAKSTLQRAQEALRDADDHSKNGESDESYSALLDSERSTKEATLLLQAKDRLDKDVRKQEIKSKERSKDDGDMEQSKRSEKRSKKND